MATKEQRESAIESVGTIDWRCPGCGAEWDELAEEEEAEEYAAMRAEPVDSGV